MVLFYLLLLAHVWADFLLQPGQMVEEQKNGCLHTLLRHFWVLVGLMVAFTHPYWSSHLWPAWVGIGLLHLALDLVRWKWWGTRADDILAFFADQFLHLVVIFSFWQRVPLALNPAVIAFYRRLIGEPVLQALSGLPLVQAMTGEKAAAFLLVYSSVIFGGSVLVRKVLELRPLAVGEREDLRATGRYIGMLERFIIMSLAMEGAYQGIGFILTAKSLARFEELKDRDFAEYYVAGTLLSTLLALAGAYLLRGLAGA